MPTSSSFRPRSPLSSSSRSGALEGSEDPLPTQAILIRFDSAGACPVVAEANEGLLGRAEPTVRWRYVARVEEPAEASQLIGLLQDKISAGEITR